MLSPSSSLASLRTRYRTRLVAGLLAVTLPVTLLLVVLLGVQAAGQLEEQTQGRLERRAAAIAADVDAWLRERRSDAVGLAAVVPALNSVAERQVLVRETASHSDDYHRLAVVDLSGRELAASAEGTAVRAAGTDWFRQAAGGQAADSGVYLDGDDLRYVLAEPVRQAGRVTAVVLADVALTRLDQVVGDIRLNRTGEVVLADAGSRLLYTSGLDDADTDADLLEGGVLRTEVSREAPARALRGGNGSLQFTDYRGREVFGGYAPVGDRRWAVVAKEDRDVALAPVRSILRRGLLLSLLGAVLFTAFALVFARRESAHLRRVVDENREVSHSVSASAGQLSSAASQLASSAAQQSAAVAETSATMEELSRTSSMIAETVSLVAVQAGDTRKNLVQAESDVQTSGERTMALAARVSDIGVLLGLINEIADQTNLLALNAAIEAARAGEAGRGFTVVAEEVRRLAERSKSSASDISRIIAAAQAETNATVMAMEKGAKQMSVGLDLLDRVAEATDQVRLTTQQQRAATEQVVQAMGQANEASRQVSATTQEVARGSEALTRLAASLEASAAATAARL